MRLRLVANASDANAVANEDADDSASAAEVVLSRRKLFTSMRLRYATMQGLAMRCPLALHDTNHAHFDLCKLSVASSRAKASDLLVFL